ncbi:MAG: hypothetical protein ABIC95_02540 [archaeon]
MKEMLLRLMRHIGKESEFKLFLDLFQNLPPLKFAVIKVSGETLENSMDSLAEDLAMLNKLDIYPIVVHGAGSILDRKLPDSKKKDGIRITPPEDMQVIEDCFASMSNQLIESIQKHGGRASRAERVFTCTEKEGYGRVGDVAEIDLSAITRIIESGITPVVSPIGLGVGGNYNINADTAAKELVRTISPKKFVLLTETGGILDANKEVLPYINLSEPFSHITGGMLLKVKEIKSFLEEKPECAVVITSAQNLLQEMFTIKGSGTFIKYHLLKSADGTDDVDTKRLKALLEDSFGKELVDGYFDNGIKEIIYEQDYEGVAIVKEIEGIPYVDKLAVLKSCQGTGLGKSLWLKVKAKYDRFILRAAPDNPFNGFYAQECQGMVKGDWHVYWENLRLDEVVTAIPQIMALEKTVVDVDGKGGEADE